MSIGRILFVLFVWFILLPLISFVAYFSFGLLVTNAEKHKTATSQTTDLAPPKRHKKSAEPSASNSENHPKANTNIKMDPTHPLKIGAEYYPEISLRNHEEGKCIVQVTVSATGKIISESIQTSSGFPRLDEACLEGVHNQQVIPATEDGKPVERTVSIPIIWKLMGK